MKRMLALAHILCLLLFLSPAAAQSLRGDVAAPERFVAQWTSNSGKMRVLADAYVDVPAIEGAHAIEASPRLFTHEEIALVARCFDPDFSGDGLCYRAQGTRHSLTFDAGGARVSAGGYLENGVWTNAQLTAVLLGTGVHTGGEKALQRFHAGAAENCRYTLEEARALADAVARGVAPDYAFAAWGLCELYPDNYTDLKSAGYQYSEGYRFCYTPVALGMPELYAYDENTLDGQTFFPVRVARLYITVADAGLFEVHWQGARERGQAQPVRLLPFEQITDVARHILPLANAEQERIYGDKAVVVVTGVALSYCQVQKRNAPGAFCLVPAWDFLGYTGTLREDGTIWGNGELCVNDALLTVNAIDGTVIDRRFGY